MYLLAMKECGIDHTDHTESSHINKIICVEDSEVGLKAAKSAQLDVCVITPSIYTQQDDFTGAQIICQDLDSYIVGENIGKITLKYLFETFTA